MADGTKSMYLLKGHECNVGSCTDGTRGLAKGHINICHVHRFELYQNGCAKPCFSITVSIFPSLLESLSLFQVDRFPSYDEHEAHTQFGMATMKWSSDRLLSGDGSVECRRTTCKLHCLGGD